MHSHKSSSKKPRAVHAPQRSNGKLRVAAILAAAEAVIAERGYEAATMAEIATRSGTKIGSLYRFFPNKESLADTMVASARENLDAVFEKFDASVNALSIRALADALLALLFEPVLTKPALMKLLDAGPDWAAKRDEFRSAVLRHIAKTLMIYSPNLPKKAATDIALVILLNVKAASTHQGLPSSTLAEFRDMARLYIESRLRLSVSARKSVPS
jgi:AcrR family transcriptional regulator